MMFKFTWLSVLAVVLILADTAALGQTSTKVVYLRGMGREGTRVFLATETADIRTLRRFEVARTARIRLYFARPPFGRLEQRSVTLRRFTALIMGKDRKPPQPTSLKTPFLVTIRGGKITAIQQRLQ